MLELVKIQSELKTPKSQINKFGGYKFRSCEDILEAVKPILKENGCIITITDEVVNVGSRFYVKATATIFFKDGKYHSTTAFAREEETKKGMDGAQITGASSSYARKYALNGLLLIDDTKDSDSTNTHGKEEKEEKKEYNNIEDFKKQIEGKTKENVMKIVFDMKKEYNFSKDVGEQINLLIKNIA